MSNLHFGGSTKNSRQLHLEQVVVEEASPMFGAFPGFSPIFLFDILQALLRGLRDRLIFSGGRPEGSKRNLNFQGAMWHHF